MPDGVLAIQQKGVVMAILIFKCMNAMCAVETFKGVSLMPLNSCPACHTTGGLLTQPHMTGTIPPVKEK